MVVLSVSLHQIMLLITILNIQEVPWVLHHFRCTFPEEQHTEPAPSKSRTQTLQGALEMLRLTIFIGAVGGFSLQISGACIVLFCFEISYRHCNKEKSTDPKCQTETISYQNGNKITLNFKKGKMLKKIVFL